MKLQDDSVPTSRAYTILWAPFPKLDYFKSIARHDLMLSHIHIHDIFCTRSLFPILFLSGPLVCVFVLFLLVYIHPPHAPHKFVNLLPFLVSLLHEPKLCHKADGKQLRGMEGMGYFVMWGLAEEVPTQSFIVWSGIQTGICNSGICSLSNS